MAVIDPWLSILKISRADRFDIAVVEMTRLQYIGGVLALVSGVLFSGGGVR